MRSPRLRLVSPREKLSEYSDARKKAGEARLSMTIDALNALAGLPDDWRSAFVRWLLH